MKGNFKYIGALTLLLAFIHSSCDNLLDINEDPLQASESQFGANPDLLFTRIQAELAAERVLESGNVFLFFTQHFASAGSAGVFIDPEQYIVPDFPGVVSWGTYYINIIKNLQLGIDLADENEIPNVSAVYQIMKAFIFYHLTITWENVPFTEAVDFETANPIFDQQEVVLRGIVDMLDTAIATFDPNDPTLLAAERDFIYSGDIDSWTRFANSLKLKTLMLIVNRDPSVAGQIGDLVLNQPLVNSNEHNALHPFFEPLTNANQLWKLHNQFASGESAFLNASTTIIDLLDGDDDETGTDDDNEDGVADNLDDHPLLATYYDVGSGADDDEYIGSVPGVADNFTNIADVSLNVLRPTEPDVWMSAAEIRLLKAEAILKGYASGDAAAEYVSGVQALFDYYDNRPGSITAAAKEAYINSLPSSPSLEDVYKEGYLATYLRGVEAWTFVRRTGYPDLPVPNDAVLSSLIRRLPWPSDTITENPNFPVQPPLDQPMWFEPN